MIIEKVLNLDCTQWWKEYFTTATSEGYLREYSSETVDVDIDGFSKEMKKRTKGSRLNDIDWGISVWGWRIVGYVALPPEYIQPVLENKSKT